MWNYLDLNRCKDEYKKFLPDWLYVTPELLVQAFDELAEQERTQKAPRCLVHGDSHQGNSFLRSSSDGNGERVWHDWQLVRKGTPWRDITYFMLGALTIEERRAAAFDLVKHYREALTAHGLAIANNEEIRIVLNPAAAENKKSGIRRHDLIKVIDLAHDDRIDKSNRQFPVCIILCRHDIS
jgi:hypothetical protein